MSSRSLEILSSAFLLAGLIGAAVAAAVFVTAGEPESLPAEDRGTQESGLSMSEIVLVDRQAYIVCVAAAGGLRPAPWQVRRVHSALEGAMERFPGIPYDTMEGCAPPLALTGEHLRPGEEAVRHYLEPSATPSPYVLAVYFVTEEAYAESFDWAVPYALKTEESICDGDRCAGVTGGIYVTPDATEAELRYAILDVEGLEPNPLDACYGEQYTYRPRWCTQLYQEAGETPPAP